MNIYSIKARFIFSLGANVMRSALSFLATLLIARALEPNDYGQLAYLMATFLALVQLFDNGTGAAFYTFISRNFYKIETHILYYFWLLVQFFIVFIFIMMFASERLLMLIWHESTPSILLLAFMAFFFQQAVWWSIVQIGEAQKRTLIAQTGVVVVNALYLLVIIFLILLNSLTILSVFLLIIIIYGIASIIFGILFFSNWSQFSRLRSKRLKIEALRYYSYCRPLIFQAIITFLYTFLINWMLRNFSGSIEQGYYQISYQFTAVSLLATTSILRVFWREVAEFSVTNQNDKMEKLFTQVITYSVLFASIISSFLVFWSKEIIKVFLGDSYLPGALVLSLMFIYPIHQSMGQVLGAAYQATAKTRVYALLSISSMIMGIIVVYFFLAPSSASLPGLHLGALGLSIEMVAMNILSVNVMYYVFCRIYGWKFLWVRQIIFICGCLLVSFITKLMVTKIPFVLSMNWYLSLILSGGFYCFALLILYSIYSQLGKAISWREA